MKNVAESMPDIASTGEFSPCSGRGRGVRSAAASGSNVPLPCSTPRGTISAPAIGVTDATAPDVAAAVLTSLHGDDPSVAALCRWVLHADVAELRRELDALRAEAARAREDFHRMRALHNERSWELSEIDDTLDENLADASQ